MRRLKRSKGFILFLIPFILESCASFVVDAYRDSFPSSPSVDGLPEPAARRRAIPALLPAASELASALESAAGVWLLEVHTDATGDSGADQALSARRARTLKLHLLEEGLAPERLFTTPHGSSRPAGDEKGNARIEIARMQ